jgi:Uma2 family endonuclease
MPALLRKRISIGPEDNGRRMTLDQFDRATTRDERLFELNKGVIEMVDVPHPRHGLLLQELRDQLSLYRHSHPGAIYAVLGALDSKVLIASAQSERHPDLSVYLSPPPELDEVWSLWVPAIVVEVVSPSSSRRDYHDKPEEYLEFGIAEYWIIDAQKQQMTAMIRWRGQWKPKIVKPSQKYTTRQLPGFTLDLSRVMSAARG